MSSESEELSEKPDRFTGPFIGIPHANQLLPGQMECCDDLPQDVVKLTSESIVLLMDGQARTFARPKELGTWWMGGKTEVNKRLCDHQILRLVTMANGGTYFAFTCFSKLWAHRMSDKLSTKPTKEK